MKLLFTSKLDTIYQIRVFILWLFAVLLPFPILNGMNIPLMALSLVWLIEWKKNIAYIKTNIYKVIAFAIPFWLAIIGLINTTDHATANIQIGEQFLFFVFSVLLLGSYPLKNQDLHFILKGFILSVFISCLLAFGKGLFFLYEYKTNLFYYSYFQHLSKIHTTYFSMYLVFAIALTLYYILKERNLYRVLVAILVLLCYGITLYIQASRIAIISLAGVITILVITQKIPIKIKLPVGILIVVSSFLILTTPNFQKRFKSFENDKNNEFMFRIKLWETAIKSVSSRKNLFLGNGTGDAKNYLVKDYKTEKNTIAYKAKYNAHNQYIEFYIRNGLLGVLMVLLPIIYLLFISIKYKNIPLVLCLTIILITMMTESILQRVHGIMFVAYFLGLFSKHFKIV